MVGRSTRSLDSMRKSVPIDAVEVDAALGILVRPRIPESEHYEHIYRTATGVRWQSQRRALVAYEVKGMSPAWWFQQIVDAVASEYGQHLELQPDTLWTNVPESERSEIEGKHAV